MSDLLQSRKFWIMILDILVSTAGYFIGKYAGPETAKDALYLIGLLQPVVLAVIVAITVQNLEGQKAAAAQALLEAEIKADPLS
jgi:hypothetical protein